MGNNRYRKTQNNVFSSYFYRALFIVVAISLSSCFQGNDDQMARKDSLIELQSQAIKALQDKQQQESLSEIYKTVKKGVAEVYTVATDTEEGGDTLIGQATCFFINPQGIALSNYHVLDHAFKAMIITDHGDTCAISKIYLSNKDGDYILFQVYPVPEDCYPLTLANKLPEIGASCFAVGNPRGLTQTLSTGIISGKRNNDTIIQTTTPITHGSSGGPLFNQNGEVIGITTMGYGNDEGNLGLAISIFSVPCFAYATTVPPTDPNNNTLTNENNNSTNNQVDDNNNSPNQVNSNNDQTNQQNAEANQTNSNNDQTNSDEYNNTAPTSNNQAPATNIPYDQIKSTITSYYEVTFKKEYETLYNMYGPMLDRYYDKFNCQRLDAVEEDKKYWTTYKIQSAYNNIHWQTLNVDPTVNGDYIVSFNMDYFIVRAAKNKPSIFNEDIIMVLNKDMKVKSIYENILNKH